MSIPCGKRGLNDAALKSMWEDTAQTVAHGTKSPFEPMLKMRLDGKLLVSILVADEQFSHLPERKTSCGNEMYAPSVYNLDDSNAAAVALFNEACAAATVPELPDVFCRLLNDAGRLTKADGIALQQKSRAARVIPVLRARGRS